MQMQKGAQSVPMPTAASGGKSGAGGSLGSVVSVQSASSGSAGAALRNQMTQLDTATNQIREDLRVSSMEQQRLISVTGIEKEILLRVQSQIASLQRDATAIRAQQFEHKMEQLASNSYSSARDEKHEVEGRIEALKLQHNVLEREYEALARRDNEHKKQIEEYFAQTAPALRAQTLSDKIAQYDFQGSCSISRMSRFNPYRRGL